MGFNPSSGALSSATDVALSNPQNSDVMTYVSGVSKWQNVSPSSTTPAKRSISGNYTLIAGDATGIILHATASSAITITLPQDSTATIGIESAIPWRAYGNGQITFIAGTGATLVSRDSVFKSAGRYAEGLVTKVAANTWLLSGDIVA